MGTCVVVWDRDNPLARAKSESRRAVRGLVDYAFMGGSRGLRPLLKRWSDADQTEDPPTKRWSTLRTWSIRYGWVKRVERWEEIQAENKAATWKERQDALREQEWDMHDKLRDRAEEMLKYPISRQTVVKEKKLPDGTLMQTIIIEPVAWTQGDAHRIAKTSSDLGRRAAGLETERTVEERVLIWDLGGVDPEHDI